MAVWKGSIMLIFFCVLLFGINLVETTNAVRDLPLNSVNLLPDDQNTNIVNTRCDPEHLDLCKLHDPSSGITEAEAADVSKKIEEDKNPVHPLQYNIKV